MILSIILYFFSLLNILFYEFCLFKYPGHFSMSYFVLLLICCLLNVLNMFYVYKYILLYIHMCIYLHICMLYNNLLQISSTSLASSVSYWWTDVLNVLQLIKIFLMVSAFLYSLWETFDYHKLTFFNFTRQ